MTVKRGLTDFQIRKVSLPFFLTVIIILALIPFFPHSVFAPTTVTFKSSCDASAAPSTTAACVLNGINGGDALVIDVYSIGTIGPSGYTPSDTMGNSYGSAKVSSISSSGSGISTIIFAVLSGSTGSDTFTLTRSSSGIFAITFMDYGGVNAFGITGSVQNDVAGTSGTIVQTLSSAQGPSSVIIQNFDYVASLGTSTVTLTPNSGQTIRDGPAFGANIPCNDGSGESGRCLSLDVVEPGASFTLSITWSGTGGCGCFASESALELQGTTQSTTTSQVTQCFGNCGSPAITLTNTNSTHTVNFNQSITLFYQFQSSLNGFILNVTTSLAKTYTNTLRSPVLGVYTIQSCPIGQVPFSSQCPGLLYFSVNSQAFLKGKVVIGAGSSFPVFNGEWIAVAVTTGTSGLDLNDTNTAVQMFQSSGSMPLNIVFPTQFQAGSHVGLWMWITGNVITTIPPPNPTIAGQNCINSDLACFEVAAICGLTPSNCFVGGIVYLFIYFVVFAFFVNFSVAWLAKNAEIEMQVHPSIYPLAFVGLTAFFTTIGVFPIWFMVLEIMVASIMFVGVIRGTTGVGQD